ncbi:tRNA pseudouridine(55) synthase TruB [Sulfurihydrogenibium subterraneum]|uniref:tRNA pseudouridine(55) synthase TruB n=1 Tax=Sulfurihydrogenibium subterraneum TaxID=171121 RepID=UPI000490B834|nr:tRNA pseudouridine(55) synthase TruB [Sulfurihydrogenibium subterraneum]
MDGILLIDKPKFITSNDLVIKVKKHLNEKVGHTGILDYAASGLMVLTVGKATKFTQFFQGLDKQYIAEGKLGEITDTYDSQGKVIQSKPVNITHQQLIEVINSFIGEYDQLPPPYSAKKIQGKRAYQLAKKGINPELKPVRVKIYNIQILEINLPYFKIKVDCSSGTYIRSLIKDIGDKLNTGAYMSDLIRTKIGEFKLEDALKLQEILDKKDFKLIPLKEALYFFEEIQLTPQLERAFKHGQKIKLDADLKGMFKVVNQEGQLLGLGKIEEGILKPEIVLS